VTIADQSEPETRARGEDLIIISGTCSKWKLANRYADVSIPLVSLEGLMSDTLHFTGYDRYVDYGEMARSARVTIHRRTISTSSVRGVLWRPD
jgi:hypothetical protein